MTFELQRPPATRARWVTPAPKLSAANDDDEELVAVEREIGLLSFYEFVKLAWPHVDTTPFSDNWHIEVICDELEDLFYGEKFLDLVICVPPGTGKSRLCGALWPVWCWMKDPTWRYAGVSYDKTNTKRDAQSSIDLIQSPWFQLRWGDLVWLPTDASKVSHFNSAGGYREACSIQGGITGRHLDCVGLDDPHKPLDVRRFGAKALDLSKQWISSTLPTRFRDAKKARRLTIMQRLHEEDAAGDALKRPGVRAVVLPMRFDPEHPYRYERDPRTTKGELLCPDRFPEEAVARLEHPVLGLGKREANAQLQQSPSAPEGMLFLRSWWRRWRVLPARFDRVFQSWDCAFKNLEDSDFVVGGVWGIVGASFYLIDVVRARMSFVETLAAIVQLTKAYPKSRAKLVEDAANGPAVLSMMKRKIVGLRPVKPDGSKYGRAAAVSPMVEAGNVYIPEDEELYPWVVDYVEEHARFPAGANDDQVDMTSQALNYGAAKVRSYAAALEKAGKGSLLFA